MVCFTFLYFLIDSFLLYVKWYFLKYNKYHCFFHFGITYCFYRYKYSTLKLYNVLLSYCEKRIILLPITLTIIGLIISKNAQIFISVLD